MTVNECESVSIKYFGNGTQQLFTFPFTYMSWYDIVCFVLNDEGQWINKEGFFIEENATTVKFLTAPPAPQDSTVKNVWITRRTDLEAMIATFYPGSSIRAIDLNNDFDQLRLAIQEGRCSLQDFRDQLGNDFVEKSQVFDREDQEAGKWSGTGDQDYLATSGAIAAREDTVVGDSLPPNPTYQQPGKAWENTDDCWSSYWNPQSKTWVAYVNTGPRGVPGVDGADADVSVGSTATGQPGTPANVVDTGTGNNTVLNFTIPKGEPGPPGTGINVNGYIDVPGPPSFNGTQEGDFVIDSNGHGWFWETDTDPAAWVDTGTIRGPEGPQGPAGADGSDGAAATIAVDNTITGEPGTDADVVNIGSNSAAQLIFTIPRGAKGDPGKDGTGAGTITKVITTKPLRVNGTEFSEGPETTLSIDLRTLETLP